MNNKIDVIIPVYNKERFLPALLETLLTGEYEDCTLIFVDDGSTDRSGAILDAASATNSNVIVRHTENHGVSAARNLGLSLCKGEWFTFCDADDLLPPHALNRLIDAARSTGCSLVSGEIEIESAGGSLRRLSGPDEMLSDRKAILTFGLTGLANSCYAKLYDRRLFGDLRFDEDLRVNEDGLFVLRALLKTPSLCRIAVPVYRYRYAEGSLSHAAFSSKYRDILTAGERKKQLADAAGLPALGAAFDARHRMMYLNKMASCTGGYTKEELKEARRMALEAAPSPVDEGRKERIRLMMIRYCFGLYVKFMQRNNA